MNNRRDIIKHLHDLAECAKHEDDDMARLRVERVAYWAEVYLAD